jgi:NAD(P)H-dependent nitrite reductase small subunit
VWLEKLEGGIEQLKNVIINDSLGICEQLEKDMQVLVDSYRCEWAEVVNNPELRAKFAHFANSPDLDPNVEFIEQRGQTRPKDWEKEAAAPAARARVSLPVVQRQWVRLAKVETFPRDGGRTLQYGRSQIAVFNFESRGEWYATQNKCPHKKDMVLSRGLIGDQGGVPKVACPQHKKTFSLETGHCLGEDQYRVATFPVRVQDGWVYVELPDENSLEQLIEVDEVSCAVAAE